MKTICNWFRNFQVGPDHLIPILFAIMMVAGWAIFEVLEAFVWLD